LLLIQQKKWKRSLIHIITIYVQAMKYEKFTFMLVRRLRAELENIYILKYNTLVLSRNFFPTSMHILPDITSLVIKMWINVLRKIRLRAVWREKDVTYGTLMSSFRWYRWRVRCRSPAVLDYHRWLEDIVYRKKEIIFKTGTAWLLNHKT
jgi:hypothetical protein